MDAEAFKNQYMSKFMGANGPDMAAIVGIPTEKGRKKVQMDVPGMGNDESINAVGIFGDAYTDPAALEAAEKYGMAPYGAQMAPARSNLGKQVPIPAHPSFNREATMQHMPGVMEGIGPGMMPGIK